MEDPARASKKPIIPPCPHCGGTRCFYKEIHPDTGMDEIVLYCPDCRTRIYIDD